MNVEFEATYNLGTNFDVLIFSDFCFLALIKWDGTVRRDFYNPDFVSWPKAFPRHRLPHHTKTGRTPADPEKLPARTNQVYVMLSLMQYETHRTSGKLMKTFMKKKALHYKAAPF